MNYEKLYESIIFNAKNQHRVKLKKDDPNYTYYENHHILPRCLGGGNEKDNLVLLTAREHFICHKLLTFIYPNNSLIYAYNRLSNDNNPDRKISSRDYQYRKDLFNNMSLTFSDIHKKKISDSHKGRQLSKSHKENISKSNKGQKRSKKSRENISNGKKGAKFSNSHKNNLSSSLKNRKLTTQHKNNISKGKYGINLSDQHKKNIGLSKKNTIWINNPKTKINKRISHLDKEEFISDGWVLGQLR